MTNNNPDHIYKGDCGICGVAVYADEERFRRVAGEDYICKECIDELKETHCWTCESLFNCEHYHNIGNCGVGEQLRKEELEGAK